jgi:hypothetical protein
MKKDMFVRVSESYNIIPVKWNYIVNYFPIFVKVSPNAEGSNCITIYKNVSS